MIRKIGLAIAAMALASTASARQIERETPRNQDMIAPVGGVVWEKTAFNGVPGVVISAPASAKFAFGQAVELPEGATLEVIREKKLKACRERTVTTLGSYSAQGWTACLIDVDGDGRFERLALNEVSGAKAIPPVAYSKQDVPVRGASANSFKAMLTFLGVSSDTLRLSYREFANDMARPAFTEELTLPAPKAYPQTMTVKDVQITVLGIDGNGLSYRIE